MPTDYEVYEEYTELRVVFVTADTPEQARELSLEIRPDDWEIVSCEFARTWTSESD